MHAQCACRCIRERMTARITCCSIDLTLSAAEEVVSSATLLEHSELRMPTVLKSIAPGCPCRCPDAKPDMGCCLRLMHAGYRCDG